MPAYIAQTWVDGPSGGTPVNAARLSHMESGIANAVTLDAAETISGAKYFQSVSAAVVPVSVVGAAGQYANLQEWKTSGGSAGAWVDAAMNFRTQGAGIHANNASTGLSTTGSSHSLSSWSGSVPVLIVKGAAGQVGDLQQWHTGGGVVGAAVLTDCSIKMQSIRSWSNNAVALPMGRSDGYPTSIPGVQSIGQGFQNTLLSGTGSFDFPIRSWGIGSYNMGHSFLVTIACRSLNGQGVFGGAYIFTTYREGGNAGVIASNIIGNWSNGGSQYGMSAATTASPPAGAVGLTCPSCDADAGTWVLRVVNNTGTGIGASLSVTPLTGAF